MSVPQDDVLAKFLAKIERRGALPHEEREAFLSVPYLEETFAAGQIVSRAGDRSVQCLFVGAGLTSRTKVLRGGSRQIVAFNIPGDAPDLQGLLFRSNADSICTHALTKIIRVSHADIRSMTNKYPLLAEALWLDTLIEASIFCEWTVNVGKRKAAASLAHLLLEMEARFASIGQCADGYLLPLTQSDLSEALALSLVHTNKSLQQLRRSGLVELKSGRVKILDRNAMKKLSGFDQSYLHLGSFDLELVGIGEGGQMDQGPKRELVS